MEERQKTVPAIADDEVDELIKMIIEKLQRPNSGHKFLSLLQKSKRKIDAAGHQPSPISTPSDAALPPPDTNGTFPPCEEQKDQANPTPTLSLKRKKYSADFKTRPLNNNLVVARYFSTDESNVRLWRRQSKSMIDEELEEEIEAG